METIEAGRDTPVKIGVGCQLEAFPAVMEAGPPSREEPWSWYVRRRFTALVRKLLARMQPGRGGSAPAPNLTAPELRAGDRVRVRSADAIRGTLDEAGARRGCSFGIGMYQFCGREYRVAKVVERFFDEARWRMLKARNLVLLEGVHCDGSSTPDTLGCDRMCFYFWRTEWLQKLDGPGTPDGGAA